MSHLVIQIFLAVVGLSSGFSFSAGPPSSFVPDQGYGQQYQHQHNQYQQQQSYYQPRALNYYQPNLNRPIIYPHLGMSPEYHNLVYKYITDFAGNGQPPHVKIEGLDNHGAGSPEKVEEIHQSNKDKDEGTVNAADKPGVKEPFRPSDFILVGKNPHGQLFENMDAIKTRKMNFKENSMTNPPLGGVMSNYVLLRNRPDFQNFIPFSSSVDGQVSKRQIGDSSDDDTVVINAEIPHNIKMNEEEEEETRNQGMDEEAEDREPAIAQSKPAAIALAGPGGVAQASPVGTALVGPGGFAVAAPSGTAVAGPAGVPPAGDEKAKLVKKKIKEAWSQ